MTLENNYSALTEKELRRLIKHSDDKALDEFDKRIEKGLIRRKTYTPAQIEEMIANCNKF